MMNFISCLFFVCFLIGSSECIVGGSTAPDGAYPYQVSIILGGLHSCAGSIISKRCVLTVAHCLRGLGLKYMNIAAGTNFLNETGDLYPVNATHYHQNYGSVGNDVGLAILEKDIVFNKKVQPIKISRKNITGNVTATLAGWGNMKIDGEVSNTLRHINLTVLTREQCEFPDRKITESHLCTFNKVGEGPCYFDSGGPLVFNGEQIGITSFAKPCAVGYPDVFTRVATFMDWIESHCPEI